MYLNIDNKDIDKNAYQPQTACFVVTTTYHTNYIQLSKRKIIFLKNCFMILNRLQKDQFL